VAGFFVRVRIERMTSPKIRSALAAISGIAILTFLPLWVRSYSRLDAMRWLGLEVKSGYGVTMFRGVESGAILDGRFRSQAMRDWGNFRRSIPTSAMIRGSARFGEHFWIVVPYWMLITGSAIVGAIAGRPWLPLRFNLRTLLFAAMLIAFMLGLSAYAAYR
jgi:hypothetical protein